MTSTLCSYCSRPLSKQAVAFALVKKVRKLQKQNKTHLPGWRPRPLLRPPGYRPVKSHRKWLLSRCTAGWRDFSAAPAPFDCCFCCCFCYSLSFLRLCYCYWRRWGGAASSAYCGASTAGRRVGFGVDFGWILAGRRTRHRRPSVGTVSGRKRPLPRWWFDEFGWVRRRQIRPVFPNSAGSGHFDGLAETGTKTRTAAVERSLSPPFEWTRARQDGHFAYTSAFGSFELINSVNLFRGGRTLYDLLVMFRFCLSAVKPRGTVLKFYCNYPEHLERTVKYIPNRKYWLVRIHDLAIKIGHQTAIKIPRTKIAPLFAVVLANCQIVG